MSRSKLHVSTIFNWVALAGAYLFVFLILSLLQMDYDDNYDRSKGEYGSWTSMNTLQQVYYLLYIGWMLIGIVGLVMVAGSVYRKIRSGRETELGNVR